MKAIYSGTFDPITLGHLDLIERAARHFDELIIVVANNAAKQALFSLAERKSFIEGSVAVKNCRVVSCEGLLVDYMKQEKITVMVRGLRIAADYDYELQLFHANKLLYPTLEVVFFPANNKYQYISSTLVREIIKHDGDITKFIPNFVIDALNA